MESPTHFLDATGHSWRRANGTAARREIGERAAADGARNGAVCISLERCAASWTDGDRGLLLAQMICGCPLRKQSAKLALLNWLGQ